MWFILDFGVPKHYRLLSRVATGLAAQPVAGRTWVGALAGTSAPGREASLGEEDLPEADAQKGPLSKPVDPLETGLYGLGMSLNGRPGKF